MEIRRTWRRGRRNSEERQKAPLTLRLNAPQVSLMNNGEQVLDRPLRGLGARRAAGDCGPYHGVGAAVGRGGRQGTAAPTMGLAQRAAGDCRPYRWLGARRAAGDCRPYHGVGAAGGRGLPLLPWGLARRLGAAGRRGLPPLPWGCRGGPQGTAAPTMGLARRAAGDCAPYRWVGGVAGEACGETLGKPFVAPRSLLSV